MWVKTERPEEGRGSGGAVAGCDLRHHSKPCSSSEACRSVLYGLDSVVLLRRNVLLAAVLQGESREEADLLSTTTGTPLGDPIEDCLARVLRPVLKRTRELAVRRGSVVLLGHECSLRISVRGDTHA